MNNRRTHSSYWTENSPCLLNLKELSSYDSNASVLGWKLDVFEKTIVIEAGGRSEEAGDLHRSVARILQHVDLALRE